jgi:hypothetical protein
MPVNFRRPFIWAKAPPRGPKRKSTSGSLTVSPSATAPQPIRIEHTRRPCPIRILFWTAQSRNTKMKSQITQVRENVPAIAATEAENILGAAREDAGFEKLLKFKKGEYLVSDEVVPLGNKYIAHVVGWTKCWIKFVDGEVVERKTYRVTYGERPPER